MSYDFHQRRAGVLLHPTSFPSGTLHDSALWLDFLEAAGLSVWQMLPLGVPLADRSPYQCLSAFAVNPALLHRPEPLDAEDALFRDWCHAQAYWLEDYALFRCIKEREEGRSWVRWPEALKWRRPEALQKVSEEAADRLVALKWEQFQLWRQWRTVRESAHRRGIRLFGDLPIFVAHDSADVWACPRRFLLDDQGRPTWVAGVPPDYFSKTGQRWGNPHYDWEYHQEEGFRWWLDRMRHHFEWFDLLRIDHFRGLQAVWMIDAKAETAEQGHWQEVPGDALLARVRDQLGSLPLVAEDLGTITPEVRALKEKYRLPGMAVLQFAFDSSADNPNKPENIGENTVVYTGTHDNDTTRGWFDGLPAEMKERVRLELGIENDGEAVEAMIRTAFDTRANLAVIPLQDFLGLGSEARMNTPGTREGNWCWRFHWDQLAAPGFTRHILSLVENSNRALTP